MTMESITDNAAATQTKIFRCGMFKYINIKMIYCIFLLLAAMGLSGCKVVQTIDSWNGILEEPPPDTEIGKLLQAELEFFAENYTLAEELYSTVKDETGKDLYVNAAQYGLACIAIATATNADELKQGFLMLKEWQEPDGNVGGFEENPKMISTAINSQLELLKCEPEIRYVAAKKKPAYEKKCQAEIAQLQETIKKLEHQISVLEAIDQEIQEKRKP